jgi:integrase
MDKTRTKNSVRINARTVFTVPDGVYTIEKWLYLRVRGNYRNFFFRYVAENKQQKDISLGSVKNTSLKEVKQKAKVLKTMINFNKNTECVLKKTPAFSEFATKTIETLSHVKMWKNPEQKASWDSMMSNYVYGIIGETAIEKIKREDLLRVLKPIWFAKTATAERIQGRLETIFSYAIAEGIYRGPNPAAWKGNLEMFLPPPAKVHKVCHFRSISLEELKEKIAEINLSSAVGASIIFGILTATRCGEFTQAQWNEIDFKNRIWSCPPSRRKDGKKVPFRVPLSEEAISLLKTIPRKGPFIFSVTGLRPIGRESPRQHLHKVLRTEATMHGMRSVFRDWCAANQIDRDLAEKSLMHTTGSEVEQAYQRSDLLELRRDVMQRWGLEFSDIILKRVVKMKRPDDKITTD